MKSLTLLLLFSISPVSAQLIGTAVLNPEEPLSVAVGHASSTVLQFPAPVEAIIGTELVEGDQGGNFQFHHLEKSNLITLRAIEADSETLMTVAMDGQLYLFHLHTAAQPSSIIRLSHKGEKSGDKATPITRDEVLARRPVYHREKYRSLINLARNPDLFKGAATDSYRNARKRTAHLKWHQGERVTVIEEVVQFPANDTLLFFGTMTNMPIDSLSKESFRILISGKSFPLNFLQTTIATSPVAGHHLSFSAVLVGNGAGKRSHFSLDNPFILIPTPSLEQKD